MSKIKRLDDQVINQIAAGEVVERPASVLKELVENAIDAGATQITVDLVEGGTGLIAVADNGSGMTREDALLSVERHATSKIRNIEDLFAIASMGFRGEALASIAAVSKFMLRSKPANGSGTEIKLIGGQLQPVSDWNGESGTTVIVEDLFYNIPARKQFLRKPATEYAHCLDFLQALSLSNLDVGIALNHNGKQTFAVPVRADAPMDERLRQRFGEVLGANADDFIWLHKRNRYGEVMGLISPPGREKSTSKAQYFFVNQRWVKEKVLRFGVVRGYHSHLLKGKHPIVLLKLNVDPGLVDVNVHPAKSELRFQYRDDIQDLIAIGIREALRQGAWASPEANASPVQPKWSDDHPRPAVIAPSSSGPGSEFGLDGSAGFSSSRTSSFGTSSPRASFAPPSTRSSSNAVFHAKSWQPPKVMPPIDAMFQASAGSASGAIDQPHETIPWSQLEYLGTFAKCYLMFQQQDRLLVVDQHAFHERILFEKLVNNQNLLGRSQQLLMPEEVTLPAESIAELNELSEQLHGLGFVYSVISDTTLELQAVPALLTKRDPEELFSTLSSQEERDFTLESNAGVNQHLLATMACHAAVRAGEELPEAELRQLLSDASSVDFYHNCPHGRRVFRWWSVSQVATWFDR